MIPFEHVVKTYPNSLEARIIKSLQPKRDKLQRVSSELRVSANLPPEAMLDNYSRLEDFECNLRFCYRKKLPYFVLFSLACLSWWIDEEQELGKVLRFLVEEQLDRFPHLGTELQLVLSSRADCLLFLQDKYEGHEQDLFSSVFTLKWSWIDPHTGGNISRSFFEIAPKTFWTKKKKPRKVQRKRGYRDHGSLGDQGSIIRRQEWQKDYSNYLEEEKILEQRRERKSLVQLLLGWFRK